VRRLNRKIKIQHDILIELTNKSFASIPPITGMPQGKRGLDMSEYIVKIADCKNSIDSLKHVKEEARANIIQYIKTLSNRFISQIIYLRCIKCQSWLEVAVNMGGMNTENGVRTAYCRFCKKLEKY
jgi:hypothetical protein